MVKKSSEPSYDGSSVQKLDGIAHIRHRPGMYVQNLESEGLHHILWEVVDNSIDEYQGGHCTRLRVRLDTHKNVATVDDNGRGVPTDIHSQTGKPTLESIFTETLMGGKFEKGGANSGYTFSAGLHGVGAKATCALSDSMTAWSTRGGRTCKVVFSQGKVATPMVITHEGLPKSKTGTRISFHPDPTIFGRIKFDPKLIRERLRGVAYLCPGLTITFTLDDKPAEDLSSAAGLAGILLDNKGKEDSLFEQPLTFQHKFGKGELLDVAMWWTDGDGEQWRTYVNMIPVQDGGTHVAGAKGGIAREMRRYCDNKSVTSDDLRDGLRVACRLNLVDPHFQGQTKDKLNNPEVQPVADKAFGDVLAAFLAKNADITRKLVARAVAMSQARAQFKATRKVATQTAYAKDPNSRRGLPHKLHTALGCKPAEREVFLVEGGSAGGSASSGRNLKFQEILPLRGKLPNIIKETDPVKITKFFENEEIDSIIRTLGCGHDVFTPGESCDPSRARHGKVILLMDADADGGHIACLLVGFFLRFMLPMVEAGRIWVANPPLFVAKWSSGRVYGTSRDEVVAAAAKKGVKNPQISRFKGLGEMNPEQLAETSLDPAKRSLTKISADSQSLIEVADLMGSDASARKVLLGLSGN